MLCGVAFSLAVIPIQTCVRAHRACTALHLLPRSDSSLSVSPLHPRSPLSSFVRLTVPKDIRGRVLALVGGVYRIGGFVGPFIGGLLSQYLGYRWPFFVQAAMVAAALPFVVFCMPADTADDPDASPEAGAPAGAAEDAGTPRASTSATELTPPPRAAVAFRAADASISSGGGGGPRKSRLLEYLREKPWFFASVAAAALLLAVVRAIRELLVPLAATDIGLSKAQVGYVTSLSYAVEVVLFPLAGYMMDKLGRKAAGVASQAGMGAAFFVLGVLPSTCAAPVIDAAAASLSSFLAAASRDA